MINTYFSDTEAVEACVCRLNVMCCDVMNKEGKNHRTKIQWPALFHRAATVTVEAIITPKRVFTGRAMLALQALY